MLETLPTLRSTVEALLSITGILLLNAWLDQQNHRSSAKENTTTAEGGNLDGIQQTHGHLDESERFEKEQHDDFALGDEIYFSATAVADTDVLHRAATKASTRNVIVENRVATSRKIHKAHDRGFILTNSIRASSQSWWCSALKDHKSLFIVGSYRGRDGAIIQIYKVSIEHVDHVVCLQPTDKPNRDTESQLSQLTFHPAALSQCLSAPGDLALEVTALALSSTTTPRVLDLDRSGPEWNAKSEASQWVQQVSAAAAGAEQKPRSEDQRCNLSSVRRLSEAVASAIKNEEKDDRSDAQDLSVSSPSAISEQKEVIHEGL